MSNSTASVPTREMDAVARLQATDPTHSYILQAPAGSGKTSVLVQRYLAVLTTVSRPEQVLAITFTRKAAGEMHARIFDALKSALEPPPAEVHRQRTHELARAVMARSDENKWNLLKHPARLNIYTIDALCRRIVSAAPLSSGVGSPPDTTENSEPLFTEALTALCSTMRSPGQDGTERGRHQERAFARVLAHIGGNLTLMRKLLLDMLMKRDQWLRDLEVIRRTTDPAQRNSATNALLERMTEALVRILRVEMEPARQILLAVGIADVFPLGEEVREFLGADPAAPRLWKQGDLAQIHRDHFIRRDTGTIATLRAVRTCADWLLTGNTGDTRSDRKIRSTADHNMGLPTEKQGGKQGPYPALKNRLNSVLEQLGTRAVTGDILYAAATLPDAELNSGQRYILESMIEILGAAVDHLQAVFTRRNLCDFAELSLRAVKALGEPWELTEVAERFDASYRHILVDEFQDTSHSQVALLGNLTKNWDEPEPDATRDRTLFLVGDPMQSIYLFRQADVSLFLQAWKSQSLNNVALNPLSLSVNFRSAEGIVGFVNRAFRLILPAQDDQVTGEVSQRLARAHRGAGEGLAVITNLGRLPAVEGIPNAEFDLIEDETPFVVRQVREALTSAGEGHDSQGEARSPVAILVQARSHAISILDALRAEGIGVTAIDMDQLSQRPHVRDLVQLTAAMAHRGNRVAWAAVLRSPVIGLSYGDLIRLAGTLHEGDLPEPPKPDDNIAPEPLIHSPAGGSRWQKSATRMAITHLIFHEARRQLLSPEGRQRLERALPALEAALLQWERRPARLLIEGLWIALGYPGCYPGISPDQLHADINLVLDTIHIMEREGETFVGTGLESRLDKVKPPVMPEARDRVTVCTIHAAKGLEWDTVILPGISQSMPADRPPLITYDTLTVDDQVFPLICPMTEKDDTGINSLSLFLKSLRSRRLNAELQRRLYVAATRARSRLILTATTPRAKRSSFLELLAPVPGWVMPVAENQSDEVTKQPPPADRAVLLPPGVLPSTQLPPPVPPTLDDLGPIPGDDHEDRVVLKYYEDCVAWVEARRTQWSSLQTNPLLETRHIATDWKLPALPERVTVPNLLRKPDHSIRARLEDVRRTVLSGQVLLPGQVFHRIMHALSRRGAVSSLPEIAEGEPHPELEELIRRALAMEGLSPEPPGQESETGHTARLRRVLRTALTDPALRWSFQFPGQSEFSVEGIQDGEYSSGRVDRTFEDPATGTRYIVDYKVVGHEGGGLEQYLANKAEGYATQLERYARFVPALIAPGAPPPKTLKLALFFAAQARWFVWKAGDRPTPLPTGTSMI